METELVIPPGPPEDEETKKYAKLLFVNSDLTIAQIAKHCKKNQRTINAWRHAYNWDQERTLHIVSPAVLIRLLNEEVEFTIKAAVDEKGARKPLPPASVTTISKLTKCVKELQQGNSPQVAMEVLDNFMDWLNSIDHNLAQLVALRTVEYLKTKMKDIGPT